MSMHSDPHVHSAYQVSRTADAWWVRTPVGASRIDARRPRRLACLPRAGAGPLLMAMQVRDGDTARERCRGRSGAVPSPSNVAGPRGTAPLVVSAVSAAVRPSPLAAGA